MHPFFSPPFSKKLQHEIIPYPLRERGSRRREGKPDPPSPQKRLRGQWISRSFSSASLNGPKINSYALSLFAVFRATPTTDTPAYHDLLRSKHCPFFFSLSSWYYYVPFDQHNKAKKFPRDCPLDRAYLKRVNR